MLTTDSQGNLVDDGSTGAAATIEDKQKQLALQLQLSNLLRNKQPDHGTMAGQVYIPPNPVNQALDMYDHVQGIRQAQKSTDALTGLNNEKSGYTNDFIKALLKGREKNTSLSPVPQPNTSTDDAVDTTY